LRALWPKGHNQRFFGPCLNFPLRQGPKKKLLCKSEELFDLFIKRNYPYALNLRH
jgi:hypothetical protein